MNQQLNAETERFARLERLFHQASAVEPGQRERFVHETCGDDETLRQELMQLLAAEDHFNAADLGPHPLSQSKLPVADRWIGKQIGAFTVRRCLGRGGMGVVYLGERRGDFDQTVAIKLMSTDLRPGLFERRFLLERDLLAALEHKNVVSLVDGGITEEGIPYLAMEYVEGPRLDAAADDPATQVEDVLNWMLQLCEAVSYVHRNMLLHRDLKPSNVLVTSEGLVKLIDFGTFKSLSTQDPALTQANMQALTVRYASPERLNGGEMSTATDVFSLGMMLYRLLLGHMPREMDDLSMVGYVEVLKSEPYTGIASELREKRVSAHLALDLEAIVQKALRFDVSQRYRTAEELAQDLRAAMEGRTISAIRPTAVNRVTRFVKRNTVAVTFAVGLAAIMVAGVALMIHGERRFRSEQVRADKGIKDETELTHFLLANYFDKLKEIPGSTGAQKQAVSQALAFADRLASVGERTDLEAERVRAYTEMGSLLGNPYEENLGDTDGAIHTLGKAVWLGQQLVAANPGNAEFQQMEAAANLALGRVYFGNGDPHKAVGYMAAAVKENRDVIERVHADSKMLAEAASAADGLGDVYNLDGAASLHDPAGAARSYGEAQRLDGKGLQIDPSCSRCRRGVALEYWKLGMLAGNATDAQSLYQQGIGTLEGFSATEISSGRVQRMLKLTEQKLGVVYLQTGRTQEGLTMLISIRGDLQKAVVADPKNSRSHFDLFGLDSNIAEYTDVFGPHELAFSLDKELVREGEALTTLDHENAQWQAHRASAELRLGRLTMHSGDRVEGTALVQSASRELERLVEQGSTDPDVLQNAANALVELHGDASTAILHAKASIERAGDASSGQYLTLAQSYLLAGDLRNAQITARKVVDLTGSSREPMDVNHAAVAEAILASSSVSAAQRAIQPLVLQVKSPRAG